MSDIDERMFLNRKGHGGLAAARLYIGDCTSGHVTAFIQISDCSRIVTLEFDFNRKKEGRAGFDNVVAKAKTLSQLFKRMANELEALNG